MTGPQLAADASRATRALFVYGTLMSWSAHPMARRLRANARLLGPGSIRGRLYDLGSYPGAVDAEDRRARVRGEIYMVAGAAVLLPMLDRYEGCAPESRQPHLYERVVRTAALDEGGELAVWTYLWRGDASRLHPIPDGRWRPPARPRRDAPGSR